MFPAAVRRQMLHQFGVSFKVATSDCFGPIRVSTEGIYMLIISMDAVSLLVTVLLVYSNCVQGRYRVHYLTRSHFSVVINVGAS